VRQGTIDNRRPRFLQAETPAFSAGASGAL
jgi:hypothetical protein